MAPHGVLFQSTVNYSLTDVENAKLCRDGSVDTVFSTGDGSYYVFKGADYWRLTDDSVAPGYPRKIAEDWPGKYNV